MRAVHDPQYIAFISKLRAARRAQECTQADLAERLYKPQSYVSKVETCERRIDVLEAARWCAALGATLAEMLPTALAGVSASTRQLPPGTGSNR